MRKIGCIVGLLWLAPASASAAQCFGSVDEFNSFMQTQAASAASVTLSFTVTGVDLNDYADTKGWLAELADTRCVAGPGVASLKVYGTSNPINTAHPPGTMKLEYGSWCCAASLCPAEYWADPMPGDQVFSQPSQVCSVVEGVSPTSVSYDIQCAGEPLHHAEGPNNDSMMIDQAAVLSEVTGGHPMSNASASNVQICFELGAPGTGGTGGSGGAGGGAGACSGTPISAALTPTNASGSAQVFSITYSHCQGAAAFRVVQAWVVDEINALAPGVSLGFEAGKLYGAGSTDQCSPGEPKSLVGTYGRLDCAKTTVSSSGTDLTVNWAIEFDVAKFAGTHGVWVDAKGGSATPEPRLGWTELGQFTVQPGGSSGSGGAGAGWGTGGSGFGGSGVGGNAEQTKETPGDSGCGCRLGASKRSALSALVLAIGALVIGIRRRSLGAAR